MADNLKERGANCTKNPGHERFIPVKDFGLAHLPPGYKDEALLELIRKRAALTVLIRNKFVSPLRPDGFPGAIQRGKKCLQLGTGFCWKVKRFGDVSDCPKATDPHGSNGSVSYNDNLCKCSVCKQSGQPQTSWWEVTIHTAAHVVFDDLEAANTEVVFFYDDTESQTITIQGTRVEYIDVGKDRCILVCVLHDCEVARTLDKLNGFIQTDGCDLEKLQKKYGDSMDKLCVIISHPHGSTKQVTVGELLKDDWERGLFEYNTPTCPGSSGACLRWGRTLGETPGLPHSLGQGKGMNRSAMWSVWRDALTVF